MVETRPEVPPVGPLLVGRMLAGQAATRQQPAAWVAGYLLGTATTLYLAAGALWIASELVAWGQPSPLPVQLVFFTLLAAVVGGVVARSRRTELVVRVDRCGVEVRAGPDRRTVPWARVRRLWVAQAGAVIPVLCLLLDHDTGFRGWWRLKGYANRQLFGTPVAVPMASTGLSEPALLELVGAYGGPADDRPPAHPAAAPPAAAPRFQLPLAAAVILAGLLPVAWVWLAFAHQVRVLPAEAVTGGVVQTLVAGLLAGTATVAVGWCGIGCFRVLIPGRWLVGNESVLRVGPEGVTHASSGAVRRASWRDVRRVYLAGPVACLVTGDPLELVPRAPGWSARARCHQRVYGAAVAVPLAGAGLAGPELLGAVRHYAAGTVTIG